MVHLGGVHRCPRAGHHAAANQRGLFQRHLVIDIDQRILVDQGELGVGREISELCDRIAIPGQPRILIRTALGLRAAAQVGPTAKAVRAVAAEDRETHDHVVARLELLNQVADLFDDPAAS